MAHPGLITISKWCDYLTFEILFGSGTQPSLDFGLSGGKFFFDGLRVAERFATLLGKDDEAAVIAQLTHNIHSIDPNLLFIDSNIPIADPKHTSHLPLPVIRGAVLTDSL